MRVIIRPDFDDLACAVILKEAGIATEYLFAHPAGIQDGRIVVTSDDVLANILYMKGCGMWFDNHFGAYGHLEDVVFEGAVRHAGSAARIVYDYYGGRVRFSHLAPLVDALDKTAGRLAPEEVLTPTGWVLLSFIVDPCTGLAMYGDCRIGTHELMLKLMEQCRIKTPEEILDYGNVLERMERYRAHERRFRTMVKKHTMIDGNIIIPDLRGG